MRRVMLRTGALQPPPPTVGTVTLSPRRGLPTSLKAFMAAVVAQGLT